MSDSQDPVARAIAERHFGLVPSLIRNAGGSSFEPIPADLLWQAATEYLSEKVFAGKYFQELPEFDSLLAILDDPFRDDQIAFVAKLPCSQSAWNLVESTFPDFLSLVDLFQYTTCHEQVFDSSFGIMLVAARLGRRIRTGSSPASPAEAFSLALWLKSKEVSQRLWNRWALFVTQLVLSQFEALRIVGLELLDSFRSVLAPSMNNSEFLTANADSILDLLISEIRSAPWDSQFVEMNSQIALFLTKDVPKLHIVIDLVRQVLARYPSIKNLPIWAYKLLTVVSKRIASHKLDNLPPGADREAVKLALPELIANEVTYKLKYAIDNNCTEPDSFHKSIYAIMIVINCVKALRRFPEAQIVRLNDIWNILRFFIHDDTASVEENNLRLVSGLEVVLLILNSDRSVIDFFYKRIADEIVPLIRRSNAAKGSSDVSIRLEESGSLVLAKLNAYKA